MEDCVTNPELNGGRGGLGEGIGAIDLAYLRDLLGILSDMEVSEFETPLFRVRFGGAEANSGAPLSAVGFQAVEPELESPLDLARARRQLQESNKSVWENPALWSETKPLKLNGTVK